MDQMQFGASLCDEASAAMQEQYGLRPISRVASFATAAESAYDPKSWAAGAWTEIRSF
ncbi:hypothetical protein [Planococcus halotolerans]|uniref:hypothetical protein n=1 Tax=Planococcus halotolerans TaxID=2233542 RepID=UPI00136784D0|nr:hypothetical protein [Planococcus halotolerans]QHJ69484.1 hypothetical protein DNR44_002045 [Planococcus halotolerans]